MILADGVSLRLRVRPAASRTAILGWTRLVDNHGAVLVAVAAPPEDGKANDAAIRLLAKAWDLPKSRITLLAGATARNKTLHVAGEPASINARLSRWLADLPLV